MIRKLVLQILCSVFLSAALSAEDLSAFERKAEMNPDDPQAQFNLGIMAYKMKDLGKAESAMKRAVKLAPGDAEAWELYGTVLLAQKKVDEAIKALEKATDIDAKRPNAWQLLGKAFLTRENEPGSKSALAAFERASKLLPEDGRLALNVGLLHSKLGEDSKAITALERASKMKGGEPAQRSLCGLYNKAGDFKKALSACGQAAQAEPKADVYYNLGFAQLKSSKPDLAGKSFEQALSLEPKHAPALYNLAFLDSERGKPEEALKHFQAAIRAKDGDFPDAQYNAAVILGDLGRWGEAADLYRALLKKDSDNADAKANLEMVVEVGVEALLNQGKDAYERGEFDAARKAWESVLKLDKGNAQAAEFLKKTKVKNEKQASVQSAAKEVRQKVASRLKAEDEKVRKDGLAAFKAGKLSTAVKLLDFYVRKNAKDKEAGSVLSKARSQLRRETDELLQAAARELVSGNNPAARSLVGKALALDPGNARALKLQAQVAGSSPAVKSSAETLRAAYYKGVDMYLEGDLEKAIQAWKKILAEDAGMLDARRSVAQAELELEALKKRGK